MVDPVLVAHRLRLENEREVELLSRRRLDAQKLGRALAKKILSVHPEIKRVWGIGSTFEEWRSYHATSDIDLAIESGDVLSLMPLVEREEMEVDLVDLSSCDASFADFIRQQGVILAEVPA